MNIKSCCVDFNHSKFVVYCALLCFSLTWVLQLDGYISISYWLIFLPLFIWKSLVLIGCIVGTLIWWTTPQLRENRTEFHAMWLSLIVHIQLALFEIFVCFNLANGQPIKWIVVFAPLLFLTPLSTVAFLWLYRNDRPYMLELLLAANVLLFIFVALKLDGTIDWSWGIVFLPVWILMCIVTLVVIYCAFWNMFMLRHMQEAAAAASSNAAANHISGEQRRYYLQYICTGLTLVFPLLAFQVLLAAKLDGGDAIRYSWFVTFAPLIITLFTLLTTTFGGTGVTRGGNRWFFGMRTDFCTFAMNLFPCLKEYGNISVKLSAGHEQDYTGNVNSYGSGSGGESRREQRVIYLGDAPLSSDDSQSQSSSHLSSRGVVHIDTPD